MVRNSFTDSEQFYKQDGRGREIRRIKNNEFHFFFSQFLFFKFKIKFSKTNTKIETTFNQNGKWKKTEITILIKWKHRKIASYLAILVIKFWHHIIRPSPAAILLLTIVRLIASSVIIKQKPQPHWGRRIRFPWSDALQVPFV